MKIFLFLIFILLAISCKSSKSKIAYKDVAFKKSYDIKINNLKKRVDVYAGATKRDVRGNIKTVSQAIRIRNFSIKNDEILYIKTKNGEFRNRPFLQSYCLNQKGLSYLFSKQKVLKFSDVSYLQISLNSFKEDPSVFLDAPVFYPVTNSGQKDIWFLFVRDGNFLLDKFEIEKLKIYKIKNILPVFLKNLKPGYDRNSDVRNFYYALSKTIDDLWDKEYKTYKVDGYINVYNQNQTFDLGRFNYDN